MIIRLFLKLFASAFIVLLIADVFYELHFSLISSLMMQLGDDILLLSFAVLLISGMFFFSQHLSATLKNYFSNHQRSQRKLFFAMARNQYLQRLFRQKKQQLQYFSELKRAALLAKNDKKQAALLAKAMLKDLQTLQAQMPQEQYKQYKNAIKQAAAQQKIDDLLALQQQITADF